MCVSYFPGPVMEGFVPYIFFFYVLHIERKTIVDTRALDSAPMQRDPSTQRVTALPPARRPEALVDG